jgi:hydrogenase maturation factor
MKGFRALTSCFFLRRLVLSKWIWYAPLTFGSEGVLAMGKKDNRRTRKMKRLRSQKKKKAVRVRRIVEGKAAAAAETKTAAPAKAKKK